LASKLDIYNMALSETRSQGSIRSLTQDSREREECDKWYDLVVRVTQEAAYWPCCKTKATLTGQVDEKQEYEYRYSYSLPTDYLRAWYLASWSKFELLSKNRQTRLFTDDSKAKLYYARLEDLNTELWGPSMTQAIVYGLAHKVARSLTGDEQLASNLLVLANGYMASARATNLQGSTDGQRVEFEPEWITDRVGGAYSVDEVAFLWPPGEGWSALAAASSRIL